MMNSWELDILKRVNIDWHNPILDWLMPAISAINAWIPFFVIAVLLVLWKGGARGRLMLVCLALAIAIGDGLVSNVLKKSTGRIRPRDVLEGLVVRDLGDGKPGETQFERLFKPAQQRPSQPREDRRGKSFPSSHTVNMFAMATVIAMLNRRWGIVMYGVALLVGYSRLYVAAHWPSDIPISMGIGILVGWVTVHGVSWVLRKYREKTQVKSLG